MSKSLSEMKKEAKEQNFIIDSKKAVRYIVNDFRLRKFKKIELAMGLAALSLTSGITGALIEKNINTGNDISISSEETYTKKLNEADDEVAIEYVKDSFLKLIDYINEGNAPDANETIETLKTSYYDPIFSAYDDYKETGNEQFYKNFKSNASDYEKRILDYNASLSFDKSEYRDAKCINGNVVVPYSNMTDNVLPDGYVIDNNMVYVPINTNEDNKSLGND